MLLHQFTLFHLLLYFASDASIWWFVVWTFRGYGFVASSVFLHTRTLGIALLRFQSLYYAIRIYKRFSMIILCSIFFAYIHKNTYHMIVLPTDRHTHHGNASFFCTSIKIIINLNSYSFSKVLFSGFTCLLSLPKWRVKIDVHNEEKTANLFFSTKFQLWLSSLRQRLLDRFSMYNMNARPHDRLITCAQKKWCIGRICRLAIYAHLIQNQCEPFSALQCCRAAVRI